jgi:hypothetical protein
MLTMPIFDAGVIDAFNAAATIWPDQWKTNTQHLLVYDIFKDIRIRESHLLPSKN